MRVLRNPVVQFLVAGSVVVAAVVVGTDYLSRQAAEREAVTDARATTKLMAHSVVEPRLPIGLSRGNREAADEFDLWARRLLQVEDVRLIKIWNTDGVIVYSSRKDLIGERFDFSPEAWEVIGRGDSVAGVSDLRRPEGRYEVEEDGLLEVYTRIESPERDPLLFEVYYSADNVAETSELVLRSFRPITVGGLLALFLLAAPLIWVLTRRLERGAAARERLLRNAVEASEAERRRIARELHERVVRDLADASSDIAQEATAAASSAPAMAQRLLGIDGTLRRNVSSLRSMVLEIYPPDLDADRLQGALEELAAPARSAGLQVDVRVDDLSGASEDSVALVWRGAQEAIRNAIRHARARRLDVRVGRATGSRPGQGGPLLRLDVSDDGVGFVPGAFSTSGRFGLRSLHDLAQEAGGRLDVSSRPGRGTTVVLEVPEG